VGSGHINVHEAGAVEFTEHKIITIPDTDGKMEAATLDKYLDDYMHDGNKDHAVHPGLVYITFPTELGTLYSARELDQIYEVCRRYEIPLYIDGARLGYGLMAEGNDVSLPYLARHCDVFYIGGTKIGALCGEAVVFTNRKAHKHFFSIQKQHGAVIAKGALIGLQFDALFTDKLYFRLSEHAIKMAMRMKDIFRKKGYQFLVDSPTNQQFVVIDNEQVERLSREVEFSHFGQTDHHHTICRFVTSWATTEEELDILERII
jgi:threonine aldolase